MNFKYSCFFTVDVPDRVTEMETKIKLLLKAFDINDFSISKNEGLSVEARFESDSHLQTLRLAEALNAFALFHRIYFGDSDFF